MGLIEQLGKQRNLRISCPSCGDEFPIAKARLFDATRQLPDFAKTYVTEQRHTLKREREELAAARKQAKQRPKIAAEAIGVGKVVEKIAPSLKGFPAASADCRSLFEPIDYVVFRGLSKTGRVDSIAFVDVKSGQARLTESQREIKAAITAGKVSLVVQEHRGTSL